MHPYTENPIRHTHGRTRNWRDSLNIFEDSHGPDGKYNPVFKTHLLGGVVKQGLIGYITMVSCHPIGHSGSVIPPPFRASMGVLTLIIGGRTKRALGVSQMK